MRTSEDSILVARRSQLIEAAQAEFISLGWSGATTRGIARRVGVSEGVIYRYFRSKEELFDTAVLVPLESACAAIIELGRQMPALNDRDRRRTAGKIHAQFMSDVAAMTPLLHVALTRDRDVSGEFYRDRLKPLLSRITEAGAQVMAGWSDERDAKLLAAVMFGTYYWLALDSMFSGVRLDPTLTGPQFADLLMRAVENPREHPTPASSDAEVLISDELWFRIEPLLPQVRGGGWRDHRQILEAVVWKHRAGCSWRQLPARFGPWQTVWKRIGRWASDGTWDRLLEVALHEPPTTDDVAWMRWARASAGPPQTPTRTSPQAPPSRAETNLSPAKTGRQRKG